MDDPYIDNTTERSMDEQTRKALELARDVLEQADPGWGERLRAMTAIDAALSAPAAPVAQGEPEPVSVIGDTFSLLWASGEPIADIAKRHGLKVGSKLYAAPAQQPVSEPAAPRAPLTDAEANLLLKHSALLDMFLHIGWYSAPRRGFDKHGMTLIRAIERACAEAWGVKLDGISQEVGSA